MAQSFKEKAHLNTDKKKFDEGWERIFGKNKKKATKDSDDKRKETDQKEASNPEKGDDGQAEDSPVTQGTAGQRQEDN